MDTTSNGSPMLRDSEHLDSYLRTYQRSISQSEHYWSEQAQRLDWFEPFSSVNTSSFKSGDVRIEWFKEGTLNACYNCVDRHLSTHPEKLALIWESDDGQTVKRYTYRQLHAEVCAMANILLHYEVAVGDRVLLFLPMMPEALFAMLACARLGCVHSVVFSGFSSHALSMRIRDAAPKLVITANEAVRGGKVIPLLPQLNMCYRLLPEDMHPPVLVIPRTDSPIDLVQGRDRLYDDVRHETRSMSLPECRPLPSLHPLFILYTSGTTGQPKGIVHGTGGYLVYAASTFSLIFNYRNDDVLWCTADLGWITGHTYAVYGPLLNGATLLMCEGIPTYPSASRYWETIDRHGVTLFYTAPTALRALMKEGTLPLQTSSRRTLRVLGSVGEPINPEAWNWYYQQVGHGQCPVIDTWWQTETGGVMIAPIPGVTPLVPGSATYPLYGISASIRDAEGKPIDTPNVKGNLCIDRSWPGQMLTIHQDHQLFIKTYFPTADTYLTGDQCYRDEKGCYWITGRIDDVINSSGHRLSAAEIEFALCSYPAVSEAAVVSYPHPVKGEGIFAFVTLKTHHQAEPDDLRLHVRKEISAIATPDHLMLVEGLPKTRSGKIIRRLLKKLVANDLEHFGDQSTLADPEHFELLIAQYRSTFAPSG